MMKKSLAATAVAAVFVLGGAASAQATVYTPSIDCTANPATLEVGQSATIDCQFENIDDGTSVVFSVEGSGATLSSLVFAAGSGSSVTKTVAGGAASATLAATVAGTYTVSVTAGQLATETATVTAAAAGEDPDTIPSTGGTVPTAALWLGAGALGLGGLAVVAATARRRAQQR